MCLAGDPLIGAHGGRRAERWVGTWTTADVARDTIAVLEVKAKAPRGSASSRLRTAKNALHTEGGARSRAEDFLRITPLRYPSASAGHRAEGRRRAPMVGRPLVSRPA